MKDKISIFGTIRGNDIECGFDMPEGLEWDEWKEVFYKRFMKCLEAFTDSLLDIKNKENDKDLEQ